MKLFNFSKPKTFVQIHKLQKPNSYTSEVLLTLMEQGHVSMRDYPLLASFRTIVSDLKLDRGLVLNHSEEEFESKYGNKGKYRVHHLRNENLEAAINIYRALTSK